MPLSSSETVEYTPCCVDSCEKQEEITLLICLLIFESCVRGSIKNKTKIPVKKKRLPIYLKPF